MSLLQRQQYADKETLLHSAAYLLPCPADPNGLRGQPGGDLSSRVKRRVAFTSMLLTTPSTCYVYSLYPEAAKLKDPDGETILHYAGAAVRKYSPGSSYSPENAQ
jgi:hypothetical protein